MCREKENKKKNPAAGSNLVSPITRNATEQRGNLNFLSFSRHLAKCQLFFRTFCQILFSLFSGHSAQPAEEQE
jgi:hypothetical protein